MFDQNTESSLKAQAQKAYEAAGLGRAQDECGAAQAGIPQTRPHTLQEEAERRAQDHYERAIKAQSAQVFFANNPGFDEFVRLVRSGVIQF